MGSADRRDDGLATRSYTPDDVKRVRDFWAANGATSAWPVYETMLIVEDTAGAVLGTATAELKYEARLGADMWVANLVTTSERSDEASSQLLLGLRRALEERSNLGGTSAKGLLAILPRGSESSREPVSPSGMTSIGQSTAGDDVRVAYFTGATIDPPPS